MRRFIIRTWVVVRDTVSDFIQDGAIGQAASIAFYTMLSLAPLLIIVIAIVGAIWGADAARGEIFAQLARLMGDDSAATIEEIVQRAGEEPSRGTFASVVGIIMLLVGTLGVFEQVKAALNNVWEARPTEESSKGALFRAWRFVRSRLLSFAMVLCIAFLLLVSMIVNAALSAFTNLFDIAGGFGEGLAVVINALVSFAVITLLFAAMYKVLPDVKVAWRDVWIGAASTALLFNVGKSLIGAYVGRASTVSVYGAAGSLVAVLLWVYYSSIIFLLGAEFTQVYARARRAGIESDVPESSGRANRRGMHSAEDGSS